jgi:hypothetical protein
VENDILYHVVSDRLRNMKVKAGTSVAQLRQALAAIGCDVRQAKATVSYQGRPIIIGDVD